MDLSWCIICDNRIEDDELLMIDSSSSLYCSQECKLKDDNNEQKISKSITSSPVTNLFSSSPSSFTLNKNTTTKKAAKHIHYKSAAPTSTYPWIPLYRKRHNYLLNTAKRYCQPTVAGSPITATAVLSSTLIR